MPGPKRTAPPLSSSADIDTDHGHDGVQPSKQRRGAKSSTRSGGEASFQGKGGEEMSIQHKDHLNVPDGVPSPKIQSLLTFAKQLSQDDDEENLKTSSQSTSCIPDVPTKFPYDMSHKSPGKAVIVNNVNFKWQLERTGSDKDTVDLGNALQRLQFKTKIHKDLNRAELQKVFTDVSTEDHSDCDCLIFCIMTHGDSGGKIHCTDGSLHLDDLMQDFKGDRCKSLAGKPKVFVIQACRGMHCDRGVDLGKADQARENAEIVQSTASTSLVIPVEADFFVAYSTPPEYVSWLNPTLGSWFIQALVKVLNEKGTSLEINQLLTRVNHIVAYQGEAKKQMPYYTSTLTKDLYFHE